MHVRWNALSSVEDARASLQTAIGVEFGTLPPYLYAMLSIPPGANAEAVARINSVVLQEMTHMCLACNMLNALGGTPAVQPPTYPGPLPGDIGPPGGEPLKIHLLPFSPEAMKQGMDIEEPEDPPDFPIQDMLAAAPETVTIGEFYRALDRFLSTLPPDAWTPHRNQLGDGQFFAGQVFEVNGYADAHRAIQDIVSEGEGAANSPLDFQNDIAHYYRFGECYRNLVLTKADNQLGYEWGPDTLDIDWDAVYPAIPDPGTHDFSQDPAAAQAAQAACDTAYMQLVGALQQAVAGKPGQLGVAVRAMFDLRIAAKKALVTPLADGTHVAGPSFRYPPSTSGVLS